MSPFLNKLTAATALIIFTSNITTGQVCIFKDTLFSINFGAGIYVQDVNLNTLKQYKRDFSACPDDGFYAYATNTAECFNGDWLTIPEDHTPNDEAGKMMIINSSSEAGSFFIVTLDGFKASTKYEFSLWMMNVCRIKGGCPPLLPNIVIDLETPSGKKIAQFKTGILEQMYTPAWKRYSGFFTTEADVTKLSLRMTNLRPGGCGNDFAMDDICIRQCYPPVQNSTAIKSTEPQLTKPLGKEIEVTKSLKRNPIPVTALPAKDSFRMNADGIKIKAPVVPIPAPLVTRGNYLVKTIEIKSAELLIQLYDNGQVDGDTVSIYHNNELVISRAGLSEKAVSFKIKVDDLHPYHELIMVADNLGSIPPNTSLMIINSGDERYEIFISSSEQKNAKLVIQQKK